MRIRLVSFLLPLMLMTSCHVASQDLTAPPTTIIKESPLPAPTATESPAETPNQVEACKLPARAVTNVGLGFPKLAERLSSIGLVKTVVLFVDFPDAPASEAPQDLFSQISPGAEKFYSDISYGRMDYQLEPYFTWLRLSQPSTHYAEGISSFEGHQAFIQEAVDLADAEVDFSQADSILVMVNPQALAIGNGPAFGGTAQDGIRADGRVFANAVTSGADISNWGYFWLNHETAHNMSLVDLYAYQYDASNYEDQHRYVGGFGLMGYINGDAPEFFAFERWQLGWLDDAQIVCQLSEDQTTTVSAVESSGGIKAVIVPLSDVKAVVVESRRPLGYDQNLVKSGALVYTVDTSIYSGEGPVIVYPILGNDPYRGQSPLAEGESVTVENVTVKVTLATADSDTVQVTVSR